MATCSSMSRLVHCTRRFSMVLQPASLQCLPRRHILLGGDLVKHTSAPSNKLSIHSEEERLILWRCPAYSKMVLAHVLAAMAY